jgi:hypothetical protein
MFECPHLSQYSWSPPPTSAWKGSSECRWRRSIHTGSYPDWKPGPRNMSGLTPAENPLHECAAQRRFWLRPVARGSMPSSARTCRKRTWHMQVDGLTVVDGVGDFHLLVRKIHGHGEPPERECSEGTSATQKRNSCLSLPATPLVHPELLGGGLPCLVMRWVRMAISRTTEYRRRIRRVVAQVVGFSPYAWASLALLPLCIGNFRVGVPRVRQGGMWLVHRPRVGSCARRSLSPSCSTRRARHALTIMTCPRHTARSSVRVS